MQVTLTYIGGPTALIEMGGVRLLTDPTFDPAGTEYAFKQYTLHKLAAPALGAAALGRVDAVLLSHDQHADNLDRSGRALLADVPLVLTTEAGAARLGGHAVGLAPWQRHVLPTADGDALEITATPARHGPADGDRGPVIGFALRLRGAQRAVYASGDTVWYEGVAEVARRIPVGLALLFMGAARVREVGPAHLTFTASEAVAAARAFDGVPIVPLHYEGWAHFSETRTEVDAAFAGAGLRNRLAWLEPGVPRHFDLASARNASPASATSSTSSAHRVVAGTADA
jgi:L-ascorbate metabolism protein UlaG (beta-lactamase superfamily)